MQIGNEENDRFHFHVTGNRRPGNRNRSLGRKGFEIIAKNLGETADFGGRKRWLEDSETVSGMGHGSKTVSRPKRTRRKEFINRKRLIETGFSRLSKTHRRRHVDDAPDGDLTVWNEGFYERFSRTEAGLPVDRTGIVGFGIGTQSSKFHPFARKYRSVPSGGKRSGIAKFGKIKDAHGFGFRDYR